MHSLREIRNEASDTKISPIVVVARTAVSALCVIITIIILQFCVGSTSIYQRTDELENSRRKLASFFRIDPKQVTPPPPPPPPSLPVNNVLQLSRDGKKVQGKAGSVAFSFSSDQQSLNIRGSHGTVGPNNGINNRGSGSLSEKHHARYRPPASYLLIHPEIELEESFQQQRVRNKQLLSQSRDKPGERFLIYTTMNREYFQQYSMGLSSSSTTGRKSSDMNENVVLGSYQNITLQYAEKYSYPFLFHPNDFNYDGYQLRGQVIQPHYYRIYAGLQLLQGIASGLQGSTSQQPVTDWIVYIDTDAFIAEHSMPLDTIVEAAKEFTRNHPILEERMIECDLITQDHGHVINSGFFLLRNTSWSRDLLTKWISECEKGGKYNMHWVWDQGPLQNALLTEVANYRGVIYRDHCWRSRSDDAANHCWEKKMLELGLQPGMKKAGKICLLPKQFGLPFLHHSHGDCHGGMFVCHKKGMTKQMIRDRFEKESAIDSITSSDRDKSRSIVTIKPHHLLVVKKWLYTNTSSVPGYNHTLQAMATSSSSNGAVNMYASSPESIAYYESLGQMYKHYTLSFYWVNDVQKLQPILLSHNGTITSDSQLDGGDYRNQQAIEHLLHQVLSYKNVSRSSMILIDERYIPWSLLLDDDARLVVPY